MKKELTYYVVFLSPGSFLSNESEQVVTSCNPYSVVWPERAYAFKLYQRDDVIDGDDVYKGEPVKLGPTYYHPDSKIETLDEVKKNPRASDILVRNMEGNRWSHVIWSRHGTWPQPFYADKCKIL